MPQLMPLMWLFSTIMSLFIMLVLIDIFYYKEVFSMLMLVKVKDNYKMKFSW